MIFGVIFVLKKECCAIMKKASYLPSEDRSHDTSVILSRALLYTLKYVAYAADGSECAVGLEFAGEFVADFPFSLYGKKSRVSIVAVTPCEIYCISTRDIGQRMKSDEQLYRIIAETNVALFDTTYNRYINLHSKSAQERYDGRGVYVEGW